MPKIELSCVICDDVRRETNGKHILIGTYNDVIVFPKESWESQDNQAVLPKLVFACFLSGVEPGHYKLSWWIDGPDEELVGMEEKQVADFEFATDEGRGIHIQIMPMVFKQLGTYIFHLELGDEFQYAKRFTVRAVENMPGAPS